MGKTIVAILIIAVLVWAAMGEAPVKETIECPVCHEIIKSDEFTAGYVMKDGTIRTCHFKHAVDQDNRERYPDLRKAK